MVESAYFVESTYLELSLELFNTAQICYRHMEDVHEEVRCWMFLFVLSNFHGFNLAILGWLHQVNNGWYASGRNTFKFGLETTLSIQESSKVNLVQSLSSQWKVLDTVTVKCFWSVSQPHLESVTGALKITIATCTFFICNRHYKNV